MKKVVLTKPKGKAVTTVEHKTKGKTISLETNNETVETPLEAVAGTPCQVGVDMSYTHNLGDFKSAKVGVSLIIPCRHQDIDDTFTYAEEWVDARLSKMIADVTSGAEEE